MRNTSRTGWMSATLATLLFLAGCSSPSSRTLGVTSGALIGVKGEASVAVSSKLHKLDGDDDDDGDDGDDSDDDGDNGDDNDDDSTASAIGNAAQNAAAVGVPDPDTGQTVAAPSPAAAANIGQTAQNAAASAAAAGADPAEQAQAAIAAVNAALSAPGAINPSVSYDGANAIAAAIANAITAAASIF